MLFKSPLRLALLMAFIAFQYSCKVSHKYSYEEDQSPRFAGDYRVHSEANAHTVNSLLRVVSFNIEFANNIEEAIVLLQAAPLKTADILLLQEMDEGGTERIARALNMTYVYYPAIFHPGHEKNVGNAILSKWPMPSDRKLKLPHPSSYPMPLKGENYIFRKLATIAQIAVDDHKIALASTHAAAFNTTDKRQQFAQAIVDDLESSPEDCMIVGGDFNSLGQADIQATANPFIEAGYQWASKDIGMTVSKKKPILSAVPKTAFQLDHLFVKGCKVERFGKVDQENVSDHLPIWIDIRLNEKSKTKKSKSLDH